MPELSRIDENRYDDTVRMPAGKAHQRQMPFVQKAHGWNQADSSVLIPGILKPALERLDARNSLHGILYTENS